MIFSSREDIASAALARLGEPPLSDLDEPSDAARRVRQLYELTVLSLLSSYRWTWATVRTPLQRDGAAVPRNEWRHAYRLPDLQTDRVGKPIELWAERGSSPLVAGSYELEGDHVLCDQDGLIAVYVRRLHERQWPGYFANLAVEALAAKLALPITENASKEQHHLALAFGSPAEAGRGGLHRVATQADSVGNPTASLLDDHDPIVAARLGYS